MLDISKPVRARNDDTNLYKVIGLYKSEQHKQDMLFILATNRSTGYSTVAYRYIDGTHPNAVSRLDLVNITTDDAARHIQLAITPDIFTSIRLAWRAGGDYRNEAMSLAMVDATGVNRADMEEYLTALFGR